MEQPEVVIADVSVIVDSEGRCIGWQPPATVGPIDPPQVWLNGIEIPGVSRVRFESSFSSVAPNCVITVSTAYVDYTICTDLVTLKPKEKS